MRFDIVLSTWYSYIVLLLPEYCVCIKVLRYFILIDPCVNVKWVVLSNYQLKIPNVGEVVDNGLKNLNLLAWKEKVRKLYEKHMKKLYCEKI